MQIWQKSFVKLQTFGNFASLTKWQKTRVSNVLDYGQNEAFEHLNPRTSVKQNCPTFCAIAGRSNVACEYIIVEWNVDIIKPTLYLWAYGVLKDCKYNTNYVTYPFLFRFN